MLSRFAFNVNVRQYLMGGLVFWVLVGVDNALAVHRFIRCMDPLFIALNALHLSIILAAVLSSVGLIGSRIMRRPTAWDLQQTSSRGGAVQAVRA